MSEIKTSDLSTLAQCYPVIAEHLMVSQGGGDSWTLYQEQFMQAASYKLSAGPATRLLGQAVL